MLLFLSILVLMKMFTFDDDPVNYKCYLRYPWHRDILHDIEAQVKEGSASFIDREKAKKDLRDTVS